MKSSTPFLDEYTELAARAYDVLVAWDGRLKREKPFFDKIWKEFGVKTIIDCGCATGHHSVMWSEAGKDVRGIDLSEDRIARTIELSSERKIVVPFSVGSWDDARSFVESPVDAVTCLGNSLIAVAELENDDLLIKGVSGMLKALKPGGVLVIQLLNYDAEWPEGVKSFPLRSGEVDGYPTLVWRQAVSHGDAVVLSALILRQEEDGEWKKYPNIVRHSKLASQKLTAALESAGGRVVRMLGDPEGNEFDGATSPNLWLLATRD